MSRLHLLILWILALGAGFLFIKSKSDPNASTSQTKLETGSPVLPENLVDTIDELKIEKDGKSVSLKKTDEQWLVAEQDNFPANINTLTRVFDSLRDAKVSQGVVASDEYYDRFNLDPSVEDTSKRPDSITLITAGEESGKLFLGKSREATGGSSKTAGRFVRVSNDDSGVYIVQQTFASIDSDSSNWIDKGFSPLQEGVIKISVSAPQDENFKPWTISRKSVIDDFLIEGLEEKQETKTNETGTLKNIFSRASFLELLSEENAKKRSDEKGTREIKATDSSGSTFLITLTPEKKEEEKKDDKAPDQAGPIPAQNYIATLKVLNGPTKPETPAADADTQAKAVYEQRVANLADLSANVNRMRKKFEGRSFLLSKVPLSPLLKNRGEFIGEKKPERKKASVTTQPIQVPKPGAIPGVPSTGKTPPPSLARPKEAMPKKPKVEATTPPVEVPTKPAEFDRNSPPPLPGSKPKPKAEPKPKAQPAPESEPKPEAQPAPESEPKPEEVGE